jgi:isocitrate dehydrogenase
MLATRAVGQRALRSAPAMTGFRTFATGERLVAPPMTYIAGEEMTHHCMNLILAEWIEPHIDTTAWEFYDLSCVSRDDTEDKVLHDAVESGARIGAIFKEPTVTPTEVQKEKLGLRKSWGSPNGAMRRGWNGITISRDTIHIDGMELGFKRPVLFERHAVGGEYAAGWKAVGKGKLTTTFTHPDGTTEVVDDRELTNESSVVVTYDNPLDNVKDLAHHFFSRCLEAEVVPYVVTKKTVFKWQEGFWVTMKDVFDESYKQQYLDAGLLDGCGGELQHLISDAATMQIIRWTDGGFGMAAHNYDGDMLTDEVAQVHRSPGFITSNLIGKRDDGVMIKEYEASHGTVADMWEAHLRGEETSLNPLGMVEALVGAMSHAETLSAGGAGPITEFAARLRSIIHKCMVEGQGTRDLCGPAGLTTEEFVEVVGKRLAGDESYTISK